MLRQCGNGWATDGLGGTDTLRWSIDGAWGTDFDDILVGDESRTEFHGMGGDDYLDGQGGDDLLFGDAGNDVIFGGSGSDLISGGTGDDFIFAGADSDTVLWNEGDGSDVIDAGLGCSDRVQVTLGSLDDAVEIYVTPQMGTAIGPAFGQTPYVAFWNAEKVELNTGSGNDTVTVFGLQFPGVSQLQLNLGEGDDTLVGARPDQPSGATKITADGGPGTDTFMGGPGRSLFVPGADEVEVRSGSLVSMDTEAYVFSSLKPETKDWLKDFLTDVAARAYNPFEPKDKIKIKIFEE